MSDNYSSISELVNWFRSVCYITGRHHSWLSTHGHNKQFSRNVRVSWLQFAYIKLVTQSACKFLRKWPLLNILQFNLNRSETALLYNDRAVLENFHISAAFKVIRSEESNILINLSKEEYRYADHVYCIHIQTTITCIFWLSSEFRSLVIDMVLATDMSSHFHQIKTMKTLIGNPNEVNIDKSKSLSLVLHCCDISHPSKQWELHRKWTELLLEEFFRQVSVSQLTTS